MSSPPLANSFSPVPQGKHRVPAYAPELAAYHRAFAGHLRRAVEDLPLRRGDRVLDVACGDGTYLGWIAPRVGPAGLAVGLDLSAGYLHQAQLTIEWRHDSEATTFVAGYGEALPFEEASFDLVWCAQSLISLPDPLRTLQEMRRVVRPGGLVAVLENDAIHHLIVPWPVELELAVRRAEYLRVRDDHGEHYASRRLPTYLARAGLVACHRATYSSDRLMPLSDEEEMFLVSHFQSLEQRVRGRLEPRYRTQLRRLCDPGSPECLFRQPDFSVTCLDTALWGRRPA